MAANEKQMRHLNALCSRAGISMDAARSLWIAVRRGKPDAQVAWNTLLRQNPSLVELMQHFAQETRTMRKKAGKRIHKRFGNPVSSPKGAWARVKKVELKEFNTLLQGGLPSLGKASR
ncbi:hypothetical protein [Vandammella animalimorsus]|nr:hypothetical protein [Vandammella animalimorsus]